MSFEFGGKPSTRSRVGERSRSKHLIGARKTSNQDLSLNNVQLQPDNQNFAFTSQNVDQVTPLQEQLRRLDFVRPDHRYEAPKSYLKEIEENHDRITNLTPYSSATRGTTLRESGKQVVESQASRGGKREAINVESSVDVPKTVLRPPKPYGLYDTSRSQQISEYGQFLQHVEFRGQTDEKQSVRVVVEDEVNNVDHDEDSLVVPGDYDEDTQKMIEYMETGQTVMTRARLQELVDQDIRQVQTQIWRKDREILKDSINPRSEKKYVIEAEIVDHGHDDDDSDQDQEEDGMYTSEDDLYDPVDSMDIMAQVMKDIKTHNTSTRKQLQQAYAHSKVFRIGRDKKKVRERHPHGSLSVFENIAELQNPDYSTSSSSNKNDGGNIGTTHRTSNNNNNLFKRYTLINGTSFLPFNGVLLQETGIWRSKKNNEAPVHCCVVVPLARVLSIEITSTGNIQAYLSTCHIDHATAKLEASRQAAQRARTKAGPLGSGGHANLFQEGILPPLITGIIAKGECSGGVLVLSGRGSTAEQLYSDCADQQRTLGESHETTLRRIASDLPQTDLQVLIPRKAAGAHERGYANTRAACHICLFLTVYCESEFTIHTTARVASVSNHISAFSAVEQTTPWVLPAGPKAHRSAKISGPNLAKHAPSLHGALERYRADPVLRDEFIFNMQKKYDKLFRHKI